jgi:predicted nucleic acid-binding protein
VGLKRLRVYFDSCAIIEAFEKPTAIAAILLQYLDWTRRGEPKIVTSELSIAEVLDKPMRDADSRLAEFYDGFLRTTDVMEVVPISRSILVKAAELRASAYCSKLPDAIHVATASEANCKAFITNDGRVRVPSAIRLVGYVEQDLLSLLSPL